MQPLIYNELFFVERKDNVCFSKYLDFFLVYPKTSNYVTWPKTLLLIKSYIFDRFFRISGSIKIKFRQILVQFMTHFQLVSYITNSISLFFQTFHCVKSIQIRSYFWSLFSCIQTPYLSLFSPNTGKYGLEITPYLDTFHAEGISS